MSSDLIEKIVGFMRNDKKIMKMVEKLIKARDKDDRKLFAC